MATALDDVLRIHENVSNLVNEWKLREVSNVMAERRHYNTPVGQKQLIDLATTKQDYGTGQSYLRFAYKNRESIKGQLSALKQDPEFTAYIPTIDSLVDMIDSENQQMAASAAVKSMAFIDMVAKEKQKRQAEMGDYEAKQKMETDYNVQQAREIAPITTEQQKQAEDYRQRGRKELEGIQGAGAKELETMRQTGRVGIEDYKQRNRVATERLKNELEFGPEVSPGEQYGPPQVVPNQSPGNQQGVVEVRSREEFDRLPAGSMFITDGKIYRKMPDGMIEEVQ